MSPNANIYAAGKMRTVGIPGLGSYDLVSGQGYSSGDYAKSPWAFACMNIRATALSELPWRLTRNDVVVETHPIIELLNGWGPEMNWADAFAATERDMLLKGCAFWLNDADRLVRLNPNTIKVETSPDGVQGFTQRILREGRVFEQRFSRDEVIYFREFHPTDDLGPGTAVIEVAKQGILAEYESQRYVKAFFENDALPGLLLRTEQSIPPGELTKLQAWWKEKFQGAKKQHKVAFVDKGLEAQILSTDLRAMALEEVRGQARKDICTAFRVPDILVGNMTDSTYANAQEARQSFTEDVILPRADYYADVINAELVEPIDASVKFEFAFDELEILQEDKDAKAQRLINLKNAGIVSDEFVRSELGIAEADAPVAEELVAPAVDVTMRAWRRKALKALRVGKSADVPFETIDVSPALQAALRVRLSQARSVSEVDNVFRSSYP